MTEPNRAAASITLLTVGTVVTIWGLAAMFTEYFGAGIATAVIGFTLATIGQELGR